MNAASQLIVLKKLGTVFYRSRTPISLMRSCLSSAINHIKTVLWSFAKYLEANAYSDSVHDGLIGACVGQNRHEADSGLMDVVNTLESFSVPKCQPVAEDVRRFLRALCGPRIFNSQWYQAMSFDWNHNADLIILIVKNAHNTYNTRSFLVKCPCIIESLYTLFCFTISKLGIR